MLLDPLQSRELFTDALQHKYAVLAVNADSPAAITDCLEAALIEQSPIIIETSLWQLTGRSFGAGDAVTGMARYLAQLAVLADSDRYRRVPVVYHTDHIKGPQTLDILTRAIQGVRTRIGAASFTMAASTVSIDSSELNEDQNAEMVGRLCEAAKALEIPATLEVEAGVDDGVTPLEFAASLLGRIEQDHPGYIWLWAPGLGSRHGFSESGFPAFRPVAAGEHRDVARKILSRDIGIVLHGSSGLDEKNLKDAVSAGVVKVNWSSESLLIRSSAAREFYSTYEDRLRLSHPQFKTTAMDNGVQSFVSSKYIPAVRERIALLGGSGRAR